PDVVGRDVADEPLVDAVGPLTEVLPGEGEAAEGQSVEAAPQGDHKIPLGPATQRVVVAHQLHRGVVGDPSPGGEQHPGVVPGAAHREQVVGGLAGVGVLEAEGVQVGTVGGGLRHGGGDGLVAVAEVDVPQSAVGVQDLAAVGEGDAVPLRAHRALAVVAVGARGDQVGPQGSGAHRAATAFSSCTRCRSPGPLSGRRPVTISPASASSASIVAMLIVRTSSTHTVTGPSAGSQGAMVTWRTSAPAGQYS